MSSPHSEGHVVDKYFHNPCFPSTSSVFAVFSILSLPLAAHTENINILATLKMWTRIMISILSWPDPQIGRSINHDTAECLAGANGEQGWLSVRSRCVRAWLREMETVIFGKFRSFPAFPASDLSTRWDCPEGLFFYGETFCWESNYAFRSS